MILLRVAVQDWKGIRGRVELGPLDPGLNLIHGPNETGKSTLLDALCRGFFDRHSTAGAEMEKRQPWGSSLGPRVEVDFETSQGRFRIVKQFLSDASCKLHRWHNGAWERTAEGSSADESILALVAGEAAGRGMTKPEHWGLGQVLWARQGQAVELEVGDSQQQRLREALRLTIDGERGEAVEALIREKYEAVYTAGGKLRQGANRAEVSRLEAELAEARQAAAELRQKLNAVDVVSHELAAAEAHSEATRDQLHAAQRDQSAQRQLLQSLAQRQIEYAVLEADRAKAEQRWKPLDERVARIEAADRAVSQAQAAAEQARQRAQQAAATLGVAQAAHAAAKDDHTSKTAERDAAEKEAARAQRNADFLDAQQKLDAAERQLAQAREHAQALAQARAARDARVAPGAREIDALRKLHRLLDQKRAELAAASLLIRIEPDRPLQITARVDQGDPQPKTLDAPLEIPALGAAELTVPGLGRIIIRAGASDARALSNEVDQLQRQWRERTLPYANAAAPASDVGLPALEALHAARVADDERLALLEKQASAGASGGVPAGTLEQALRDARLHRQALLADDPELASRVITPDQARADLALAKNRLADARKRLQSATAYLDEQARAFEDARDKAQRAASAAAVADAQRDSRAQDAAALRAADSQTDAQRRACLDEARRLLDEAAQRLAAAPKPPVDDLNRDIGLLDKQIAGLQKSLQDEQHQLGRLQKSLDDTGGQGLYSQLALACERLAELEARHQAARLDADAIKLLWDTLEDRKSRTLDALLLPVRAAVQTQFEQLVGPRYERVEFDDRLAPASVRPSGRGADAQTDALSYGTREQLMLLVRLALARLVGREGERQCVILDDPLVNADRARQRTALRILQQASQDAQIVILTCDPAAYEGLGVPGIDLAQRVRDARG